jgi:hypothetical protein
MEKNSQIYIGKKNSKNSLNFLSPKKRKNKNKNHKKLSPQKNHQIHYFGYITKLKKKFDEI